MTKIGVYVDSMNIVRNGGYGMRYEVLRRFATRNGGEIIRLNAYVALDEERARSDLNYNATLNFISTLRDLGFKVIEKPIRWFTDEDTGKTYGKANADMDMALDIISQSDRLDLILLLTGDGDFCNVVTMVQNKGCRVELVAFNNVSSELRREVDLFVSGYLIPGLLPVNTPPGSPSWGEPGSRVRGVCTKYLADKSYGFMRFIYTLGKLWITDTRQEGSPYKSVFFMEKDLPPGVHPDELPSRNHIFEFTISEGEKGYQASDISLIYQYHS